MELEQLYRDTYPKLYAFFYAKTSSREAAEDLTQEVFYEAVKGVVSFAGHSSVRTWLFGIAKNKLSRHYRSNRYKANLEKRLAQTFKHQSAAGPEDHMLKNETQRLLLEQINRMDEPAREIVLLRVYGELSFKEIGTLAGISENHARVIFHRAKMQLLKEVTEMGKTDG